MKNFIYFKDQLDCPLSDDVKVACIPPCNSKDELMDQLSKALCFPTYFGRNWDALWDCMVTLSDIPQKNILVVHGGLLNISEHDFDIYITLMYEAINVWNLEIIHEEPFTGGDYGQDHYLDVAFPEQMKERIEHILGKEESSILYIIEDFRKNLERHQLQYKKQIRSLS